MNIMDSLLFIGLKSILIVRNECEANKYNNVFYIVPRRRVEKKRQRIEAPFCIISQSDIHSNQINPNKNQTRL